MNSPDAIWRTESREIQVVAPTANPTKLAHALCKAARDPSGLALDSMDAWWDAATRAQRIRLVLALAHVLPHLDAETLNRLTNPRWRLAVGLPLWLATFALTRQKQRRSRAANTVRAWRMDWHIWRKWCKANGHPSFNPSTVQLEKFLKQIGPTYKRATIRRIGATLTKMHLSAGLSDPLTSPLSQEVWIEAISPSSVDANGNPRRSPEDRRNLAERQARGMTFATLKRALAAFDHRSLLGARDAALLRMAYDMLARQSELVGVHVEHLSYDADGSGTVLIPHSKTDQKGEGRTSYIRAETVVALRRWLALAQITSGAVFRSLRGFAGKPGAESAVTQLPALPATQFRRIIKKRMEAITDRTEAAAFSGHSARVGAAQDMSEAGHSDSAIASAGRWSGTDMVVRYTRNQAAKRGGMAKLAKQQRGEEE